MPQRMMIDATHAEETRVVVMNGSRLEEFDFEASTRKQLKGNIYLAKITRVEPSLQAAFVEFGGNRHGFLAFNEIHSDYYQIPIADRQALAAEQAELELASAQHDADEAPAAKTGEGGDEEEGGTVEQLGGGESDEMANRRSRPSPRNYKIHEVIKKRQILLVQVVKEERGTKGAALTTYISIAGRYCVLMPNTPRGGGISRKITDVKARKKLRAIASDLAVPEGMGVIIRTAGLERTKAEIKRDCDYLLRQWEQIRELTLKSTAPSLIFEEANLIKRTLRDLYSSGVDEILVEGEDGHKTAKDFMRMMMPSHAKKVKLYKERIPLFQRYKVEGQLDAMHSPTVQLKSGGYIVINPTEALVAIDVNSGRSTKERNIEETASKTNLEAADEVARQIRLRDLAGLIVVDFIDMDERRNDRNVEKRFKDALKTDRARIQLGRISPFGLLEMSRQRLRPSIIETSTSVCPYCGGQGHIRSIESTALHVLRAIEEEGVKESASEIAVYVPTPIALYLLNQKRASVVGIEERYGLRVTIERDDTLVPPNLRIERTQPRLAPATESIVERPEQPEQLEQPEEAAAEEAAPRPRAAEAAATGEEGDHRRRRRRRRRDGEPAQGKTTERAARTSEPRTPEPEEDAAEEPGERAADAEAEGSAPANGEARRPRRRRGRRGGRRRGRPGEGGQDGAAATNGDGAHDTTVESVPLASEGQESWDDQGGEPPVQPEAVEPAPSWRDKPEPAGARQDEIVTRVTQPAAEPEGRDEPSGPRDPARKGWWQRLLD
ncbi:MAG: ribonuclease E/G [Alphaproteobacteria bacterium]|nr:ribonuclease E/G [Alphaproteobacteria bacterium]